MTGICASTRMMEPALTSDRYISFPFVDDCPPGILNIVLGNMDIYVGTPAQIPEKGPPAF